MSYSIKNSSNGDISQYRHFEQEIQNYKLTLIANQ